MFLRIKGGEIFSPTSLGSKDVLLCGSQIAEISDSTVALGHSDIKEIDASNCYVVPGFVESHTHFLGAGGVFGPTSRNPEIQLSSLFRAGITTAMSPLGTDNQVNTLLRLLMKARALEDGGVTTYIYTGGFQKPIPSITGSVMTDQMAIDKVIGVKTALYEPNASRYTKDEFMELVRNTRLGGTMSNKAGILLAHLGKCESNFEEICDLFDEIGIPMSHLVLTHVNLNKTVLEKVVYAGKRGVNLDITANMTPDLFFEPTTVRPCDAIKFFLDAGIPLSQITMSSDSNAGVQFKKYPGTVTDVAGIYNEFKKLVVMGALSMEEALSLITSNPAMRYGISDRKGYLAVGKDADVVILDKHLDIKDVIAKGKLVYSRDNFIKKGPFEEA